MKAPYTASELQLIVRVLKSPRRFYNILADDIAYRGMTEGKSRDEIAKLYDVPWELLEHMFAKGHKRNYTKETTTQL